jgi:uncharacterized Zn-binding protein involved in type VI secretion
MGVPAAKQDDEVVGLDIHVIMIPSPAGPVPTPIPMPFVGKLSGALSTSVKIDNKPAAVKGSTAQNQPQHIPAGGPFQNPPSNQGTVDSGSSTVFFDGNAAARLGDIVKTCNDPTDAPAGVVIATGMTVFID